ncbi:MAG TPA: hypothetical protein VNF24_03190 [Candidatus Acidoferrales bacterium]|nr:hypothetical protein [Candidatus Acidoferrales bacterium]
MEAQTGGFRPPPLGVGALLDAVFSLYRHNFWLFVTVVAVVQVPYQILITLLVRKGSTSQLSLVQGGRVRSLHFLTLTTGTIHPIGLGWIGLVVFAIIALPLELAAVTQVVAARYQSHPTSAKAGFRIARGRWLPLLGVGLIVVVIAVGALALLGLVTAVLAFALHGLGVLLALLLWLVAVVVGIVAYLRVVVASSVVVLEPTGPWLALRRSWELTRGSAWRILWILLVLTMLSVVLSAVGGTMTALLSLLGGGTNQPLGGLILLGGGIVLAVLITPMVSVGLVLLYFDLRARREGSAAIPVEGQPAG